MNETDFKKTDFPFLRRTGEIEHFFLCDTYLNGIIQREKKTITERNVKIMTF